MKFVVAIHGILTRRTDPAWPWMLQAHAVRESMAMTVQAEHYWAGPFPLWNKWVTNPNIARAVARRVQLIGNDGVVDDVPLSIVAHSNGTNIAVELAMELYERGQRVDELILIGSSLESDVESSGLLELVSSGAVGRVVAYCSRQDKLIKPLEWLTGGYGALGAKGLVLDGGAFGLQLSGFAQHVGSESFVTRWFENFEHSEYFDAVNRKRIFELICADLEVGALGCSRQHVGGGI